MIMSCNNNMKHINTENALFLKTKESLKQNTKDAYGNVSTKNPLLLTNLPNEILGKVMDLLSFDDLFNLERVNKRMQEIALNVAWPRRHTFDKKTFNFGLINENKERNIEKISEKMLESVLSRARIKSIDLSQRDFKILTNETWFQFHLAPQLIKLVLKNIKLTNDNLKIIAISCPLLEHTSFDKCFHLALMDMDEGLKFFYKKCQKLKLLDLSNNRFSSESFAYVPGTLRYLNLSNCFEITSTIMELLSNRAKNLETLIMRGFEPTMDVNLWLRKLTKLRFLDISWLYADFLPSLNFFCLPELEMLCVSSSNMVTIETLKSLKNCQKLKCLDLSDNEPLDGISIDVLKSCKALKYCDFSYLKNLNNIVDLVQTCKLEYLAINNYSNGYPENVVKSLILECDSLSQLEIYGENYDKTLFLPNLLEKSIQRSHILKLYIRKIDEPLPSCNWCEVISDVDETEFPTFNWIHKAILKNTISF